MENRDDRFFELLKQEVRVVGRSAWVPDDDLISLVLSKCELLKYRKNYRLIDEGDVNTSLYILKSGALRISYFREDREVTLGMALEPTATISPLGFTMSQEAHYIVTACAEVEVYKLRREAFDALIMDHPAFARWMLGLSLVQMALFENKSKKLKGSTQEKYLSLRNKEYTDVLNSFEIPNAPDISRDANDKVIASYLDVHPSYLSTIKRELIEEERAKKK